MSFVKFRDQVNTEFNKLAKNKHLFVVDLTKDDMWEAYLSAFPEGTDPLYNERTEHDCSACRQFIKVLGNVVSVKNGRLSTVWNASGLEHPYDIVADKLDKLVKSRAVTGIFSNVERQAGHKSNVGQNADGSTVRFNHFYASIPAKFVVPGESQSTKNGTDQSSYDVLKRGVEEITDDAIETVLELIQQNSLYRGQEHLSKVRDLKTAKEEYSKLKTDQQKTAYLWKEVAEKGAAVRYRNSVIGTLMTDLSEGVDLETAVRSFEQKVAPQNYRRPTALITQSMIKQAREKVESLGLEDALHRRFAVEEDLTINNVMFADRSSNIRDSVFDDLAPTSQAKKPSLDKVKEMTIDEFVENVLPKVDSLEVFLENSHVNNLVSLVAPKHNDSPNIFNWNNNFSWSYNGEVTDSIKERVKSAGGNVTGEVRASLSWFNYDDLDIHVRGPGGHIYFGNRLGKCGGKLDVDMNAGGRDSRSAVENIFWQRARSMKDGTYRVEVNNFSKRESKDVGFEVEFEYCGQTETFSYERTVADSKYVPVLEFSVKNGNVDVIKRHIDSGQQSKEVWGLSTGQFHRVKTMMLSPNYWDDQAVGNKHWFFMLEDCENPDEARGFYNEFLRNELVEHRKVFEVLSSKMKTAKSKNQLSGLGFSSTKENSLLVKASGSFNRVVKIKF